MSARDDNSLYTRDQLESYAAARVAEATAELEALVADLFAQYTRLYGVPVDKPPFTTHNPAWKALAERAGILADCEGGEGVKIKPRHVKMARAAWRAEYGFASTLAWRSAHMLRVPPAAWLLNWHLAARGK